MTRRLTALVFLGRLALVAQPPSPAPKGNAPSFSRADMERLIVDLQKVMASNVKSATATFAKQFSAEMEQASKTPPAQRPAAMQKATEEYRKRVDAFNQGGQNSATSSEATTPIINPTNPEKGYYRNLLDACMDSHKFVTRADDGMPVFQQVTTEGGSTVIRTFTPGLPTEKAAPSDSAVGTVCPTLVKNAVKASPPSLASASLPRELPEAMQICAAVCTTLAWKGDRYQVMARDGQPAAEYTVESFTPASFILRRMELPLSGDYGLTALYKGTFKEGDDTAQGTVDFTWAGKPGFPHSASWRAAWGNALVASAQKKPEERGDSAQLSDRQFRDKMARLLMLGLFLGAMGGDGDTSSSSSGACTAGYWQNPGGMGQTWVCTAHGK